LERDTKLSETLEESDLNRVTDWKVVRTTTKTSFCC